MTRVKGAKNALKRRRSILKRAKGYRFGRSTKERQAKEAVIHAGIHAFNHRRDRKNDFRRLWQIRINAGLRALGSSYSTFMGTLKKRDVGLNRKMLATIAKDHPETFKRIVNHVN